jgi:hypothetical protein
VPRDSARLESGAAGRPALASFHDEDFADLKSVVRFLPQMNAEDGPDKTEAFIRSDVRGAVDMLGLARPTSHEQAEARSHLGFLFHPASVRLLRDPTRAGDEWRTFFLECVETVLFAPSVRAVFERSGPAESRGYEPELPNRGG